MCRLEGLEEGVRAMYVVRFLEESGAVAGWESC